MNKKQINPETGELLLTPKENTELQVEGATCITEMLQNEFSNALDEANKAIDEINEVMNNPLNEVNKSLDELNEAIDKINK